MNPKNSSQQLVDDCYYENQRNSPESELAKYYGQQVAWSRDGRSILASGATLEELFANMKAKGIDPLKDAVVGYVDVPGEVHLGWF